MPGRARFIQSYFPLPSLQRGCHRQACVFADDNHRAKAQGKPTPLIHQYAFDHALNLDVNARQATCRELFRDELDTGPINAIPDLILSGFSGKSTIIWVTGA